MRIYIGTDHAGFDLKETIKSHLFSKGHTVEDLGAFEKVETDDYPDFVVPVAEKVSRDPESFGIVLGGSGQGEAMAVNRVRDIRATVFYGGPIDIVEISRKHNNANVLSIGARFVNEVEAIKAVDTFIETPFSADERHIRRISKF